jgi:hypothetical protein
MTTLETKRKKFKENRKQIKTLETRNEKLLEQIRTESQIHPDGTVIAQLDRCGGRPYWMIRRYDINACDLEGTTIADACTARGELHGRGGRHPIRIEDKDMHKYEVINVEANRKL